MFKVAKERCDECLFSPHKVVSDERRKEIIRECKRRDGHFICHKFTIAHMEGQLSPDEANVCCKGFWDANPEFSTLMQIAGRLGWVEGVDLP